MEHYNNTSHPSKNHTHQYDEIIPSSSLVTILVPIFIAILIVATLLLALMLRRLQFSRKISSNTSNTTKLASTSDKRIIKNSNCMFIAHSTINIGPEHGCLYGNSSIGETTHPKFQVQVLSLKDLEIATNNFSERNVIGIGVYRGVLRDGAMAAIKTLPVNGRSAERAFRSQVDLLSRLRSPYISQFLGYCADQNHRLLIFEYMPNGSLERHLHRCGTKTLLKWPIRMKIALDCARALEYLHEHVNPSIIHRNFKCTNILLDHNFRAKLSGFGLAKIGSDKLNGLILTRVLGTTGYLAPEYASTGKLSTKSDVYSYGVILLELLTGRVPIDTTRPPGQHVLVSWALPRLTNRDKLMEMVDPALEGRFSTKDLIQVAAIAAMCVQTEADYRPLITDVVQSLLPLIKDKSHPCSSTSLKSFIHSPNSAPKVAYC